MEVKLQVSSNDWLKVHGLEANALMLDQLLPTVGFLQRKSEVSSLGRPVSSQYGDGVFVRQENSAGQVYNICGTSRGKLGTIEKELKDLVSLLKARYQWLITGSRLQFGVVCGRRVVMVIDYHGTEHAQLKMLIDIAVSVIREQFIHIDQFNVITCSSGVSCWREGLVGVSDRSIEDLLEWVEQTKPQTPPLTSNILQALSKALEHTEAESVYLLSYGESSLRAFQQLLERVRPSLVPVHISVFNCEREDRLEQYRTLASASSGRCHIYTPPSPLSGRNPLLTSVSSLASSGLSQHSRISHTKTSRPSSANISLYPHGLTDADTQAIWGELDSARNTLAQIQALQIEMSGVTHSCCPETTLRVSDNSMTSDQWLREYGLRAKRLMFESLVQSLAFKHCNGTVRIPLPPKHKRIDKVEMVSHTKVVHAQYCKEFVHMRWPEGQVIHVQLSKHAHCVFCEGVEEVVGACRRRLAWLKRGSRELFGTLLESKIIIVVDTSVSMAKRLDMLKRKLQELIQEQLSSKNQFTVFHFNSQVYSWRDNLVTSSPQTLTAVSQWVDGLTTGGSTNTQAALVRAMTVSGAEAVYLMTDGRPDTPTDVLLAKVQQLPKIPVHTISFNCADSKANHFLAKLASNTGGRYHYLSEDVGDPDGPKTYKSEDITRLEEEIKTGLEQIERANQLLAECQVTRRRCGKKRNRATKTMQRATESDSDSGGSIGGKPLASTKKWLAKNSLSALKLTLMDALGPASIPHTAKHVPILQKDVHSKVFSQLFSLAHVNNANSITLIHPNGVNLVDYESHLADQIQVYWTRLSQLAWSAIPIDSRPSVLDECGLEEGQIPSYHEHQAILRRVLSDLKWPCPELDFELLEEEIRKAETYQQYSRTLREEAKKKPQSDTVSLPSGGSQVPLMENPLSCLNKNRFSKPSKSTKVIIRSKVDGFYYPGIVTNDKSKKSVSVQVADRQVINANSSLVIPVGGARPCPILRPGDRVLVRVRASRYGRHPTPDGRCDYYIPGVIQVLPENERKGHALFSVLVFNGRVVACNRRGIVKITEKRYSDTYKYICEKIRPESAAESEDSHSEISCAHSNRSSTHMPTPPDSDQDSQISSPPSIARDSGRSRASDSRSTPRSATSNGINLLRLMESQRVQEELIEQYCKELTAMQQKQKMMEEQLATRGNVEQLSDAIKQLLAQREDETTKKGADEYVVVSDETIFKSSRNDLDDFPEVEDPVLPVDKATDTQPTRESVQQQLIVDIEEPHPLIVQTEEVGVNTDTMTEERCVGTGPMTKSIAIETEWSRSDSESDSDEPDNEPEQDKTDIHQTVDGEVVEAVDSPVKEPSVQDTPVSTPIPTPPLSRVPTPDHTHHSTPSPSKHNTPKHIHSPTPSPDHVITPAYSHTSIPSHKEPEVEISSTPAPITPTPQITPMHSSFEVTPLINQQVLARWPDDGWYYRCVVVDVVGEGQWKVEDAIGDTEIIASQDIITDLVDSQRPLELGDTVAALHPNYTCSYSPGVVAGISSDGLSFSVNLYDAVQTILPRHEVYRLARTKQASDVQYIKKKEAEWVGVACVARNNTDGLFYPGKVERQLPGTRRYVIQWPDGSVQEQEALHLYGPLTRKHPLRIGDHVIALADPKVGACMPGIIAGTEQNQLIVEFCDGQNDAVDPTHCFWVSREYHQEAVDYICSHAPPPSDVGGAEDASTVDTNDVPGTETSDYS